MRDRAGDERVRRSMRKLGGSIISAFAGWSAGLLVFSFFHLRQLLELRKFTALGRDWWMFLPFVGLTSAVFVFTVWLVLLVPLYFLVPARSLLWKWPICRGCGALSGAGLLYAWHRVFEPHARPGFILALAAIIGGVTCLTGALTRKRFDDLRFI